MKIPVIIAAHNEEAYIGRTLAHLDADCVEPIVAINGTTDATRSIAESYGAQIVEREEQGKLPAIQVALKQLGGRALEPVLYLDSDSYPRFKKRWAPQLAQEAGRYITPSIIAAPVLYCDGRRLDDVVRSSVRVVRTFQVRNQPSLSEVFGSNMATRFLKPEVLEAVLAMPHVWPGEDRAIAHEIAEQGGLISHTIDPRTIVMTSARYHTSLHERIFGFGTDRLAVHQNMLKGYYERSAPNVEKRFIAGEYEDIDAPSNAT